MRIVFLPAADADLEGIADYIARDNPRRALTYVSEIRMHCKKIAASPLAYPARDELAEGLRSCVHGAYVIFFAPGREHVTIVRILHGARDRRAVFGIPPT